MLRILLVFALLALLGFAQAPDLAMTKKNAEGGDARAQFDFGMMYHKGDGLPKDYAKAVKWYRLAAAQGEANAQNNLGIMYAKGEGVPKDDVESANFYRLSAEQGNVDAQWNLGYRYTVGRGLPKDDAEAVKWYRLAADQGNVKAQNSLGVAYWEGKGVAVDINQAHYWLKKAATRGDKDASKNLEAIYKASISGHRQAAEQGNVSAQFNLGVAYYNGDGVSKDLVQAHAWLNIATANGFEDAKQALVIIEEKMTDSQKERAMDLARELFAKLPKEK